MLGRRILGLVVLLIGLGFLLDALGLLEFGQVLGDWWPTILIALGLLQLTTRSAPWPFGAGLIILGALLLYDRLYGLPANLWSILWPLILIAVGLAWLLGGGGRWHRRHWHDGPRHRWGEEVKILPDERINQSAVFGGYDAVSRANPFRGGQLAAVFGGVKLDLREAQLPPEGAEIEASAVFGGVEILVPPAWRVEVRGMPIFGGIDDKTASASAPPNAPVLRVKGSAMFGGVTIHHGKHVNPPFPPHPIAGA